MEEKVGFTKKIISKDIFIPFGIEIEMEGISFQEGERIIRHKIDENWKIGVDRSLKDVINFEREDFVHLLKMLSVYENIIYRFSTGEEEHIRKCVFEFACPIGQLIYHMNEYQVNTQLQESYINVVNNKFFALSLKTKTKQKKDPIQVVEFRTPNGTCNYDLWFNYITFFSAFLTHIKSKNYDKERIDYLFTHDNRSNIYNRYPFFKTITEALEVIEEEKALQLANLIFTNEEDKTAFYKQYIYKK